MLLIEASAGAFRGIGKGYLPKVKGKERLPALSTEEQVVLIRSLKAVAHSTQTEQHAERPRGMNRFAKSGDVRAGANGLGSGTRAGHLIELGEQSGDSGTRVYMAL